MKILYSVQATGNGHISRAMELLPYLEKWSQVDIFLSGANSTLILDAPVKYRSRGLSLFYTCNGTLDHWKLAKNFTPFRIMKEVRDLPVEKYDLILNDFECITSLACAYKKVPSVHFGHQASFLSPLVPRPDKRNNMGEWILKNYARGTQSVGLHFENYDDFIVSPVIKEEIVSANPVNHGHITVYLPSYCDPQLLAVFLPLKDHHFEIFSCQVKEKNRIDNVTFIPVNKAGFNKSMISCYGIITGAGFETPAEGLYLKKKMIAIPIKGQYEQECNAAALKKLGVTTLDKLDDDFKNTFHQWVNDPSTPTIAYSHSTDGIIDFMMNRCTGLKNAFNPAPGNFL